MPFFTPNSAKENGTLPADILSKWSCLASNGHEVDPFCSSPVWNLAYHEAFSPQRRLYFDYSTNAFLALAETVFENSNIYFTPVETNWMFSNPILGPEGAEFFSEAIQRISASVPTQPHFVISGVNADNGIGERLLLLLGKSHVFFRHSTSVQGAASLSGGLDGYLGRRSANHRAKLKKAARIARRAGMIFERHCPSTAVEANCIYRRMLAVEHTSWKGIGHCGMAEAGVCDFYGIMLRRLAVSRSARVIFAIIDGRDVGFIFGGICGHEGKKGIYRGQQFSYAADLSKMSIGNLLQLEKITWLCEQGISRYDMGPVVGPRMNYKKHWTEQCLPMETWIIEKK